MIRADFLLCVQRGGASFQYFNGSSSREVQNRGFIKALETDFRCKWSSVNCQAGENWVFVPLQTSSRPLFLLFHTLRPIRGFVYGSAWRARRRFSRDSREIGAWRDVGHVIRLSASAQRHFTYDTFWLRAHRVGGRSGDQPAPARICHPPHLGPTPSLPIIAHWIPFRSHPPLGSHVRRRITMFHAGLPIHSLNKSYSLPRRLC